MKTELVWEGKYDEYGHRREIDMAGLAMPMQRIETIDQPRSEAAAANQLDLFNKKTRRLDDFRNRLIWGDNKLVMASLLQEFRGKIDLIYIDPPFDVGADFTMNVPIGDGSEAVEKDQSALHDHRVRKIGQPVLSATQGETTGGCQATGEKENWWPDGQRPRRRRRGAIPRNGRANDRRRLANPDAAAR